MKKQTVLILAVAVLLSLTACSGNNSSATSTTKETASTEPTTSTDSTDSTDPTTSTTPTDSTDSTDSTDPTTSTDPATPEETEVTIPLASSDLSTEWSSYQFELNGKIYSLPVSYSEFVANGWAPKSDKQLADTLEPDQYRLSYITLYNGENEISVEFANLDKETLPLSKCYVSGIMFTSLHKGNTPIFPGNIAIGSPMDTVKTLYGEPPENKERSYSIEWMYQEQIYDHVKITFDPTTKIVTDLSMANLYLPE